MWQRYYIRLCKQIKYFFLNERHDTMPISFEKEDYSHAKNKRYASQIKVIVILHICM